MLQSLVVAILGNQELTQHDKIENKLVKQFWYSIFPQYIYETLTPNIHTFSNFNARFYHRSKNHHTYDMDNDDFDKT